MTNREEIQRILTTYHLLEKAEDGTAAASKELSWIKVEKSVLYKNPNF